MCDRRSVVEGGHIKKKGVLGGDNFLSCFCLFVCYVMFLFAFETGFLHVALAVLELTL